MYGDYFFVSHRPKIMQSKELIHDLNSFYYQNIALNLFLATVIFQCTLFNLIPSDCYILIASFTTFPHFFEWLRCNMLSKHEKLYFGICGLFNAISVAFTLYLVKFDPTILGISILMYSYMVISYLGVVFWGSASILMVIFLIAISSNYPVDMQYLPMIISLQSVIFGSSFMIISANNGFNNRERLISILLFKDRLVSRVGRYISPQLIESLTKEVESVESHQRKDVVIFFSDLTSFTELSEQLHEKDVSYLLNEYLSEMSAIAEKYGATIDKFIGDGIMIFFGAPTSKSCIEDARSALLMAGEMQRHMHALSTKWVKGGYPDVFSVRIGIHSGVVTVGNFGSKKQVGYTVIGKAVNIASRLENKCPPSEILVSERIANTLPDMGFTPFKELSLKGVKGHVKSYTYDY